VPASQPGFEASESVGSPVFAPAAVSQACLPDAAQAGPESMAVEPEPFLPAEAVRPIAVCARRPMFEEAKQVAARAAEQRASESQVVVFLSKVLRHPIEPAV
jgi:hypothetical protein